MAGYGLRGAALQPRVVKTPQEIEAEQAAAARAQYGDFGGGLASAVGGMIGSTKAYAASGLDALGAESAAKGLYDSAAIDARNAGNVAPEIATTDQITNASTLSRYVAGKLGGAAGSLPPALLGGVAGRMITKNGLGAALGAGAAYQPVMAGGHVQELNANPNTAGMDPTEKFLRGTGIGTVQAGVEGLGPAYMANRLFKRNAPATSVGGALRNFGTDVAKGAALEGGGAAVSDVIGQGGMMQADPTVSYDGRQTFEAGIGEAVGGAGFAVPGAAVANTLDYLNAGKGAVADATKNVADATAGNAPGALDATQDFAGKAVDKAKDVAQTFSDAGAMFKNTASGYLKHPELAKLVAAQELPPEMEGKNQGEILDWLAQDSGARHRAAMQIAQRTLIDREASDSAKAIAQQLLDNPTDPESWKPFADGMILKHQQERLAGKLGQAASELTKWVEEKRGKSKSNMERTPRDEADEREFISAMRKPIETAIGLQDSDTIVRVGSVLQNWVANAFATGQDGLPRIPNGLIEALGPKAHDVIAAAYATRVRQGKPLFEGDTRSPKGRKADEERALAAVKTAVAKKIARNDASAGIVMKYLTPTMYEQVTPESYSDIAEAVQYYLQNTGASTADQRYHITKTGERTGKGTPAGSEKYNTAFEEEMQRHFGANTDAVLEEIALLDKSAPQSSLGRGMADAAASMGQMDDVDGSKVAAEGETGADANMALEDDYNAGFTELNPDGGERYMFNGEWNSKKKKEAFDTEDAFLDTKLDLARKTLAPAGRSLEYNRGTKEDRLKLDRVGVMDYASETGDRALLDDLLTKHPDLTHEQINQRFFVAKNEASEVDQGEAVDVRLEDLNIAAGKKGSWEAHTRIDRPLSKGGNIDVSTIANGRLYLRGHGFDTPFVTSANVLIRQMWGAKKLGAFDEGTAGQVGAADKLAMFTAGLSSLMSAGIVDPEVDQGVFTNIQVKMPDGKLVDVDSMHGEDLPDDFVIWDSNDPAAKLTLGQAKGLTNKKFRAKKQKEVKMQPDDGSNRTRPSKTGKVEVVPAAPSEKFELSDIPNMTRTELSLAADDIATALAITGGQIAELKGGVAHKNYIKLDDKRRAQQAKLAAFEEAIRNRATERAPGQKKETATTFAKQGNDPTTLHMRTGEAKLRSELAALKEGIEKGVPSKPYTTEHQRRKALHVDAQRVQVLSKQISQPHVDTRAMQYEQKAPRWKPSDNVSETEEMAAGNEKKYRNTEHKFEEETGLEVQPRDGSTKGRANLLQQQVTKLRAEYKELAEQVAKYEAKEGKNAIREAALKRGHAKLAALVEQGKKLAAELAALPPVEVKTYEVKDKAPVVPYARTAEAKRRDEVKDLRVAAGVKVRLDKDGTVTHVSWGKAEYSRDELVNTFGSDALLAAQRVATAKADGKEPRLLDVGLLSRLGKGNNFDPTSTRAKEAAAELKRKEGKTKNNMESTALHNMLQKPGFAATHDSPIKHEGKFNWRQFIGKGEGNAAFGAGTYLSTLNRVHEWYKKTFTAKLDDSGLSDAQHEAEGVLRMAESDLRDAEAARTADNWVEHKGTFEPADGSDSVGFVVEKDGEWGKGFIAVHSQYGVPFGGVHPTLQGVLDELLDEDSLGPYRDAVDDAQKNLDLVNKEIEDNGGVEKSPTYQVSVNIKPEELLDWDAPLSEQKNIPAEVIEKAALRDVAYEMGAVDDHTSMHVNGIAFLVRQTAPGKYEFAIHEFGEDPVPVAQAYFMKEWAAGNDGEQLYKMLTRTLGSQAKASDYLQSLGILGHKYNAEGGKESEFPNYVIYDDSKIETNFVEFNLENPVGKAMTEAEKAEVSSYIEKTLGPRVAVLITDQLKGSGEWSRDAKNQNAAIKIATTALNPLSVAHHEAMHEFFQRLLDGKYERAADVLRNAADSPLIRRQLKRHFAGQDAVLEQIENDVEERIAYMFQLWASGKLDIGTKTETVFRKVINIIRKTLGLVSQEKQLEAILQSFHDGKMAEPGAMAQVLDSQEARAKYLKKIGKKANPALKKANEWVGFAESALTGSKNPFLDAVGRTLNNKTGSKRDAQGFLSAKEQANNLYMNKFANALRGVDPTGKDTDVATKADVDLALEGLQTKTWHKDPLVLRIQQQVQAELEKMYEYMDTAGVKVFNPETKEWDKVGKIKDYRIPRSWDPAKIIEHSGKFKEMLFEHHTRALEKIAEQANAEIAAGRDAGDYTASWEKRENGDETAVTAEDVATAIVNRLINSNGQNKLKESAVALGFSPFAKSVNEQTLWWIDEAVFAEFMEKDITKIISTYVGQITKRAEYSRRFGADGEVLQQAMDSALDWEIDDIMESRYGVKGALKKAKAAAAGYNAIAKKAGTPETTWQEQLGMLAGEGVEGKDIINDAVQSLEPARRAIMAMEGTLGHDISVLARKASAYTIVYQNVRLLGYALFANLIDPLGMMVNGAEFKDAYSAFKRGMRDVGREWGDLTGIRKAKDSDRDDAVRVAEMIGTVDSSGFMSQMGTIYSSQYLPEWAKNANDTFFRWNGLEAFNKSMRVGATQAAISFIKRHYESPNDHSDRYFEELGLTRADVQLGPDGALNVENRQVQQAVMRWVDGAILRPNAAIRPTMASDPHYAVFYHLKQFMYAMHAVILKRVMTEIKHGNNDPLILLFAGYVPMMLAADSAKGLIQEATGNGQPYWQHDSLGGVVAHGVERAGLLGVGQLLTDTVNYGPLGLFGPAVEQAADLVTQPLGDSVADATMIGPLSMELRGPDSAGATEVPS